ncbi:MAG: hypothetical protein D6761_10055 [Candidatus Dadabacteria bacterium]|nr:MAG: hypothetical protein D6761_10055 [Candidatus Dadabacteria bacterium]
MFGMGDSMTKRLWRALGLRGTLVVFLLLLVGIVGLQNMEPFDIDFLFWDLIQVSKLYFILADFGLGIIAGLLIGWMLMRRPGRSE